MNLQSPVSKIVASKTVRLNIHYHAPRALRWALARVVRYHSTKVVSFVSGNMIRSNMMPTHIGLPRLTYAQDTELLRNDLVDPDVEMGRERVS